MLLNCGLCTVVCMTYIAPPCTFVFNNSKYGCKHGSRSMSYTPCLCSHDVMDEVTLLKQWSKKGVRQNLNPIKECKFMVYCLCFKFTAYILVHLCTKNSFSPVLTCKTAFLQHYTY